MKLKLIHLILQSEIKNSNENGMSLVAVIVITTLFSTLVLTMATQQWANSNMNAVVASEQKSYYIAEAGIEFAIRRSMDLDDWNWTISSANFADGTVSITVSQLGGDSVQIVSKGQAGVSAKQNTQIINALDLSDQSVFINGNTSGWFWSQSGRTQTNEPIMPEMDLDSLKSVSQGQGHYHAGDYTYSGAATPWSFWEDPGDHSLDATVIYVEGDLSFTWSNFWANGLFVVLGDVRISGPGFINGIIYLPNNVTQSLIYTTWFSLAIITGAIVGNTGINGAFLGLITVFHNSAFVDKFYTYAINADYISVERLTWAANY